MRPGGSLGAASGATKLSSSREADTPLRACIGSGRGVREVSLGGQAAAGSSTARRKAMQESAHAALACGTPPERRLIMSPTKGIPSSCWLSAMMLSESSTPTAAKGTMVAPKRAAMRMNSVEGVGRSGAQLREVCGSQQAAPTRSLRRSTAGASPSSGPHPTSRARKEGSPRPCACTPRARRLCSMGAEGESRQGAATQRA